MGQSHRWIRSLRIRSVFVSESIRAADNNLLTQIDKLMGSKASKFLHHIYKAAHRRVI